MQFNNKKRAFTLAEIIITLFIIAIIAMLTAPIVSRQMAASDDYAYYMAFKSIEKMGAQIAVLGDDEEIATTTSYTFKDYLADKFKVKKINQFIASLPQNFAKSEEYVFRKFFPKVFAAEEHYVPGKSELHTWSTDELLLLWQAYQFCSGSIPLRKGVEIDPVTNSATVQLFQQEDFDNCCGYTKECTDPETNITIPKDYYLEEYLLNSSVQDAFNSTQNLENAKQYIKNKLIMAVPSYPTDITEIDIDGAINMGTFCTFDYYQLFDHDEHVQGDADYNTSYSYYKYQYLIESDITDIDSSSGSEGDGSEEPDTSVAVVSGACVEEGDLKCYNYAKQEGNCTLVVSYTNKYSSMTSTVPEVSRPSYDDTYCKEAYGHYGKYNGGKPDNIVCECSSGSIQAVNNDRVCCPIVESKTAYAYRTTTPLGQAGAYSCISCETDFDSVNNRCCPKNSTFNGSECVCVTGYEMNATNSQCDLVSCPAGYTLDSTERKCVKNPPMIRAQKFCEEIHKNWNVAPTPNETYCQTAFSTKNSLGSHYNEAVYKAALGDGNTTLFSTKSQKGAFAKGKTGMDPHVVLSNGVKLWLLGDKAASIPGLSFNPEGASSTQNMCVNLKKTSKTECKNSGGYFCSNAGDNNCYTLDSSSLAKMGDARNCCSSPDNADLAFVAASDPTKNVNHDVRVLAISGFTILADVNGDRGSGTLWEDVFPFFIASNGRVFPGYPMDSYKASNASVNELYDGGNSETLLPTDVYYYETNEAGTAREKKVAFGNVSYARAMCSARYISPMSPYCRNLGEKYYAGGKFKAKDGSEIEIPSGTNYLTLNTNTDSTNGEVSKNPCDHYRCFVSLRRKARLF